jgi:hypothetical protein
MTAAVVGEHHRGRDNRHAQRCHYRGCTSIFVDRECHAGHSGKERTHHHRHLSSSYDDTHHFLPGPCALED